ncbi:MAG: hypothetical protein CVT77_02990 [Alphaproteobacteria bacterium HGW-Alphaproteobacteria-16]|nr:MAG: hypothetical protein CVT77_02990 [Alphaproteobacteria bacterium HGW-Alphaproteobacteria-16]
MNMAVRREIFADAQVLTAPPVPLASTRADHVFDLHPALHIGVFAGFFAYLGIMWAAFGEKGLIIPFAIFTVFLAAAFIVPGWWARVAPNPGRKTSWMEFMDEGLVSGTGRLSAGGVVVQVMIMPAMLVLWGLIVAAIKLSV